MSATSAAKVETNDSENESSDSERESEDSDYAMEQLGDSETNATKKSENGFEVVPQHCKCIDKVPLLHL